MTFEEALEIVEKILPPGSLTPIKRQIFQQAWNGKEYAAIAKELGYENSYIRDAGAQLWRSLSEVLHEPINKRNFRDLLQKKLAQELLQSRRDMALDRLYLSEDPEYPGRAVPLHSKFYIRYAELEQKANAEISRQSSLLRIKAPLRMGKSSFLIRIMNHASNLGYHTISLNFKQIETNFFANLNQFLSWFCTTVSYQLELEPKLEAYWSQQMSHTERCMLYFTRYLLPRINRPLVLAFNNFDEVLNYPQLAQDFLFMIQAWHEEAAHRQALQKLRLILVYSSDVDSSVSPKRFYLSDMGRSIRLPSFNRLQVQTLVQRYELPEITPQVIQAIMELTGGHPYLVQLTLYHLWMKEITVTQLLQPNSVPEIYHDHLQSCLITLRTKPELSTILKRILGKGGDQFDSTAIKRLQELGFVSEQNREIILSNLLYRMYFSQHL